MKVIYSKKHYEWLMRADVWPKQKLLTSVFMPREAIVGNIITYDDQVTVVEWNENKLYREFSEGKWRLMPATVYSHFHDNLEVIVE